MAENALIPLYQQIKEDIKAAIQSGTYQPKDRIPPEPALSKQYSVSRITVRRAVEELCKEGYLTKVQGRGTFVNTPHIYGKIRVTVQTERITQDCTGTGIVLDRKIIPAQTGKSEFLGINSDELLLLIQRLYTAGGRSVFLENIVLPYQRYKKLMTEPLEDSSIFNAIEDISGSRMLDIHHRTFEVTRADPEQARQMGITVGEPLLWMSCYFIDQDKKAVCISQQYYVGSRYMLEL